MVSVAKRCPTASPVLPMACGAQQPSASQGVTEQGGDMGVVCGGTPPWGVYGAPAHSAASVGAGSSKGSGTAGAWTPPREALQLVLHNRH